MQRGEVWFAATSGGDRPVLILTRDPVADRIGSVVVAALTRIRRGVVSELELNARKRRGTHRVCRYLRQPPHVAAGLSSTQGHPTWICPYGGSLSGPEGRNRLLAPSPNRCRSGALGGRSSHGVVGCEPHGDRSTLPTVGTTPIFEVPIGATP